MSITTLAHMKSLALRAKSEIAQLAQATVEAVDEVESLKQDKTQGVSATIATSGWTTGTGSYPCYYDIAAAGITAADEVRVFLAPDSMKAAVDCGMSSTCETLAGKIRIRAKQAPTSAISVEYRIEKGKE